MFHLVLWIKLTTHCQSTVMACHNKLAHNKFGLFSNRLPSIISYKKDNTIVQLILVRRIWIVVLGTFRLFFQSVEDFVLYFKWTIYENTIDNISDETCTD